MRSAWEVTQHRWPDDDKERDNHRPRLPDHVLIADLARGNRAHLPDAHCLHTRNGPIGHLVRTSDARVVGITWCLSCWPGRRCATCADPSGESRECARCHVDGISTDTAYECATDHQEQQ